MRRICALAAALAIFGCEDPDYDRLPEDASQRLCLLEGKFYDAQDRRMPLQLQVGDSVVPVWLKWDHARVWGIPAVPEPQVKYLLVENLEEDIKTVDTSQGPEGIIYFSILFRDGSSGTYASYACLGD